MNLKMYRSIHTAQEANVFYLPDLIIFDGNQDNNFVMRGAIERLPDGTYRRHYSVCLDDSRLEPMVFSEDTQHTDPQALALDTYFRNLLTKAQIELNVEFQAGREGNASLHSPFGRLHIDDDGEDGESDGGGALLPVRE